MDNRETVRINFEFPKRVYPDLKYLCAMKGVTLREFMTSLAIRELEEAEDQLLGRVCEKLIYIRKNEDLIDWEEAKKEAGWE